MVRAHGLKTVEAFQDQSPKRSREFAADSPETGIYIEEIAINGAEILIYIGEIAAEIEEIDIYIKESVCAGQETGIYIEEIASNSREIDINWSEIATYSREIAADVHEIAANIGEIRIYTCRTAARSRVNVGKLSISSYFRLICQKLPRRRSSSAQSTQGRSACCKTVWVALKLR